MVSERNRSVFEQRIAGNIDYAKQLFGMTFYLLCFGIVIPYTVIKSGKVEWLEGYLPNLDLIASILGFRGGPFDSNIFKYLYNPTTDSTYGYYSQMLFNYIALLGLTYIVAYYTFKTKSINNGWSRAFVMLWLTYLLPSNIMALWADKLGKHVDSALGTSKYTYMIVTSAAAFLLFLLVMLEKNLVQGLTPFIVTFLNKATSYLKAL